MPTELEDFPFLSNHRVHSLLADCESHPAHLIHPETVLTLSIIAFVVAKIAAI